MDGLPHTFPLQATTLMQRTLKASISCVGVGLHSGAEAEAGHSPGPRRQRHRLPPLRSRPRYPRPLRPCVDTRLCTVLGLPDRPDVRVGTVEHIMAALAGAGVSNAIVEIDGPEMPILDGSAASFLFLIDCAGLVTQPVSAPVIEITAVGPRRRRARPAPSCGRRRSASIWTWRSISRRRPSAASRCAMRLTPDTFRTELARARTFTLAHEIEALRAAGLALGGSLDNAVVVDHARDPQPWRPAHVG